MTPATTARARTESRLLVWRGDPTDGAGTFACLPSALDPGDLVVVNDSGTLPASLRGFTAAGEELELRLTAAPEHEEAIAVVFGAGDHRSRTEDRPPPPPLAVGDELLLGPLHATVVAFLDHPRLVRVRFAERGATLFAGLFRHGTPIQYAYVPEPLALWDVQNVYSGRPLSAELPSAGRGLTFRVLEALSARGIGVTRITHAAGLSSTGDPSLDARLPFPERAIVSERAAADVRATQRHGGRVVAIGTSVVRALESAALASGEVEPINELTTLRLDRHYRRKVVSGIVTGVHAAGESHYDLLEAFAPRKELDAVFSCAEELGMLAHEFGDAVLLWGRSP